MAYNPQIHQRKSIRLKGYDYTQAGLYFITICTQNRECLFGEIVGATLVVALNGNDAPNKMDFPNEMDFPNGTGQPQGIARTTLNGNAVPNGNDSANEMDFPNGTGQPQGIAPTTLNGNDGPNGNDFQNNDAATNGNDAPNKKGQPQGIAPTDQNETDSPLLLNDAGNMIVNEWLKLPERFNNIQLHEYVVMPNHFHAILEIVHGQTIIEESQNEESQIGQSQGIAPTGVTTRVTPTELQNGQPQGIAHFGVTTRVSPTDKTVGDMVGAFKSITTVEYICGVKQNNWQPFNGKLWQRNYWEHIIRNENEYNRISEYILNNPRNWDNDSLK